MTGAAFPPGPRSTIPLFYQLAMVLAPMGFLRKLARDYGDFVHYRSGRQHLYLCNHPDLIKEVLVTQQRYLTKGLTLSRAGELLGTGLLTSEGARHRAQRRVAQPAFHQEHLATYADTMVRCADEAAARWRDGEQLDTARAMMRLTLRIVGTTLFDPDFGLEEAVLMAAVEEILFQLDSVGLPLRALRDRLPTPANRRYRSTTARLDAAIERMLAKARRGNGTDNLLTMMLEAHEAEVGNGSAPRGRLRDEVRTLLLAGNVTLTTALSWCWYLLARHPEVEARLHEELERVLAGQLPSLEALGELRYTRMVLAETLRLYPPVWNLSRRAAVDCEIGSYRVPAGSLLLFSPYLIHHDPRYYPEPERFDPSRWTAEAEARRPRLAYFPFGAGPRGCIGEPFAWMEGVLVIATLAQRWRFRRAPRPAVRLQPGATLRSRHGVPMITERRQGSER